ncbi:tetratricopeptide repeat protein [Rhodomicrobium vannielii ATCC 17100]|uniref:tetratricopeptide repeat protein n=1 Tax=Rhodomicrobium vannielii TaxID=1069 RepID=UPI00191824C8|nr:tetratricopeptide repeat protein [Rhodomicrobium vannielii]MBJ7533431.1 tetratricopeptide repeat protein [Rhodomicrobium vannielii ATCC 17100]
MRLSLKALLLSSFLVAPCGALRAQTADYDLCRDDDSVTGIRIAACSRIIDDIKVPQEFRADAYLNRGEALADKGDFDAAIADETLALKIKPNFAEAHNLRAWIYFKAGKSREGLPDAERAVTLAPLDAHALDTRAHIYEALGRKEEALADYRRALSIDADLTESKDGVARLLTARPAL